jgi:hypothetical protein
MLYSKQPPYACGGEPPIDLIADRRTFTTGVGQTMEVSARPLGHPIDELSRRRQLRPGCRTVAVCAVRPIDTSGHGSLLRGGEADETLGSGAVVASGLGLVSD